MFIAFEGIEGSGKTTQVRMLAEHLRAAGMEPVVVREPGGTPFAEQVRQLLLHEPYELTAASEAALFQAARADVVARVIRPALAAGKVVICDRFEMSTRAYQGAGRGLPPDRLAAAIALATDGLLPHLYLVLDTPVEAGRDRQAAAGKAPDRLERADAAFHARVAEAFRSASGPGILHMDGTLPPDRLHSRVREALAERFPQTFSAAAG